MVLARHTTGEARMETLVQAFRDCSAGLSSDRDVRLGLAMAQIDNVRRISASLRGRVCCVCVRECLCVCGPRACMHAVLVLDGCELLCVVVLQHDPAGALETLMPILEDCRGDYLTQFAVAVAFQQLNRVRACAIPGAHCLSSLE
jgi:hypothetical protein